MFSFTGIPGLAIVETIAHAKETLRSSGHYVLNRLTSNPVTRLFVGDILTDFEELAEKKAMESKDGVGIVRLGPAMKNIHYVILVQPTPPIINLLTSDELNNLNATHTKHVGEIRKKMRTMLAMDADQDSKYIPLDTTKPVQLTADQLNTLEKNRESKIRQIRNVAKHIIDLPDENARGPYFTVGIASQSSFFLGMSAERSRPYVKNFIHRHFTENALDEVAPKAINELIKKIMSTPSQLSLNVIKKSVLDLLTQHIFGFRVSDELKEATSNLRDARSIFLLPAFLQRFSPSLRKLHAEFNVQAEPFLRSELRKLRSQDEKQIHDAFANAVKNKLPADKSFKQMTDSDIEQLILNPDIRLCITGLLAIDNITKAIAKGLHYVFRLNNSIHQRIFTEISSILKRQDEIHREDFTPANMPYLHAFYLEVLRLSPPMRNIIRWSETGFTCEHVTIPPRSIIDLDLDKLLESLFDSEKYPAKYFTPERFLNSDGTLNELAKLHQDLLIPFGTGLRSCPVSRLSGVLFKFFICGFVNQVPFDVLTVDYKKELIHVTNIEPKDNEHNFKPRIP